MRLDPAAPGTTPPPATPAPVSPPAPTGLAKATADLKARAAAAAAPAAPVPDPAPETPPPPVGAPPAAPPAETPPPGEAPPVDAPPAEVPPEMPPAEEPPPAEVPPAEPTEITVSLPGARAEDPEEEFVVTDPKHAETLNRLKKGYLRREDVDRKMASVKEYQAERAAFEESLQVDPVGVVQEALKAPSKMALLRSLLIDPDVEGALAELPEDDPLAGAINISAENRRLAEATARADRADLREKMRGRLAARQTQQKFAEQVTVALESIAAPLAPQVGDQFVDDALGDLKAYIGHNRRIPELDEVPLLLKKRLAVLGIDLVTAAQRMQNGFPTAGNGAPAAPAAPATPARPQVTAAQLKKKLADRAAAAAIPSGAHGAPVASGEPARPAKGSGLAGAAEALKKLVGMNR